MQALLQLLHLLILRWAEGSIERLEALRITTRRRIHVCHMI
jgi:hypothetical protein